MSFPLTPTFLSMCNHNKESNSLLFWFAMAVVFVWFALTVLDFIQFSLESTEKVGCLSVPEIRYFLGQFFGSEFIIASEPAWSAEFFELGLNV